MKNHKSKIKIKHHNGLTLERWYKYRFCEQMANVGADVGRTISWREKGNLKYSKLAFKRALELLSLTIEDPKNKFRLKELTRLREVFIDFFRYDNIYQTDEKFWQDYFYSFNYAARL